MNKKILKIGIVVLMFLLVCIAFLLFIIDNKTNKKYETIKNIELSYKAALNCETGTPDIIRVSPDLIVTKTIGIKCNTEQEEVEVGIITKKEYDKLISILKKNKFYSLAKNIVAENVLDGYYFKLTVVNSSGSYTIEGWNSDYKSKRFKNIANFIKRLPTEKKKEENQQNNNDEINEEVKEKIIKELKEYGEFAYKYIPEWKGSSFEISKYGYSFENIKDTYSVINDKGRGYTIKYNSEEKNEFIFHGSSAYTSMSNWENQAYRTVFVYAKDHIRKDLDNFGNEIGVYLGNYPLKSYVTNGYDFGRYFIFEAREYLGEANWDGKLYAIYTFDLETKKYSRELK